MRLQGVIFDVDGTLIDSNDLHAKAWVEAFEHFGTTIDFDTVRSHIGKGGDLLIEAIERILATLESDA
jgi:beta-phosphoglucomutase-like phosphatase (HAD superfamily)